MHQFVCVCISMHAIPSAPKLFSLFLHLSFPPPHIQTSSILTCLLFFNRLLYHITAVMLCDPWAPLHISYATHRQYLGVPESKTAQSIAADSNSLNSHIQQSTSRELSLESQINLPLFGCIVCIPVMSGCSAVSMLCTELVALSVLTWKSLRRRHTYWTPVVYFRISASKPIFILFIFF